MDLAITNVTVFDGTGKAPWGPATVLIEGDKIEEVGPSDAVDVPENLEAAGKVIDGTGMFLMPGLVDCHVHITNTWEPDHLKRMKQLVPYIAIRSTINAKNTLEAGITAVRDAGAPFLLDVALKQAIERGIVPGPRLKVACRGLSITGGHGDSQNGWPPEIEFKGRYVVDSPDEARRAAREQLRDGADHLKLHATGGVMSEGDVPTARGLTFEEMRAAIEEAHNVGKKTMAHAQGSVGIKNAILAGISSIEHGFYLTDEIIELMLKRDVFLVPTLSAVHHIVEKGTEAGIPPYGVEKAKEAQEAHLKSFYEAYKAGVKIAMGTDAATPFNYHGNNALELELMVNAGMKPIDALVSATRRGAELMGWGDRMGQVKPGFWADLILVDGSPVDDVRVLQDKQKIKVVIKGGVVVVDRRGQTGAWK
ncbi:MAG TPA: amidohydrolase family protein [Bacillota bacterium]|jgi:imidazolonepropionase-like amidohydrolase|nr:amidohydrolase family protein [Candidatus Fermentithermobacillaceae bacterium]HAF67331.1 amidohydrolase family protein [Clostridiales bacterium UBA9857]HOA71733.1 amidohydrolase family protein [Bacillota bacterium]HOP71346.1 amidohydrolase family protein [Bacillota bacterium]HPT35845.1 amidohydrolase family protein [Bacillota bacterium]